MRPLGGALVIGMALACLAVPARAQDDDGTAEEAAPPRAREPSESDEGTATEATGDSNGQEAAAARAARRARIRAARAARRQAALEREAAAQAEAEAKAPVAPTGTAPAKAEAPAEARPASGSEERAAPGPAALPADTGRLDVKSLDTLPAAAATHEEQPAAAPAPVFHAPPARGEHAVEQITEGGAGEEGTHPAFSVKAFILQLINFGVLLFLLIYWGGRAFNKLLRTRHEQLRTEIGEATRVRDQAKRKFEAQERRLAELEKEIADLRAAMRKDAEAEQARLLQAAQERGQRIQDEMRAQVEEQVKIAEAALRAEVANASVKLAEDMVRQAVSFEDERRLAREFVAGFGKPGTPSPDEEVR